MHEEHPPRRSPTPGRPPPARLRLAQHGQREVVHSVAQRQQAAHQARPVAPRVGLPLRQPLPGDMRHRVAAGLASRLGASRLGAGTDRLPGDVRHRVAAGLGAAGAGLQGRAITDHHGF